MSVIQNQSYSRTAASEPGERRESPAATLARNLLLARQVLGVTQSQLAADADVSRATIAQIESGVSDPRISTVADLAHALGLSPVLLLLAARELNALLNFPQELAARPLIVSPQDEQLMRAYLASGRLRDLHRAAQVGADVARAAGEETPAAAALAAIFSTLLPGAGTRAGAVIGRLLT